MDTALRELVRSRAGSRCEYCHLPEQFSELHFHILRMNDAQRLRVRALLAGF
jgi:hypothetical protein